MNTLRSTNRGTMVFLGLSLTCVACLSGPMRAQDSYPFTGRTGGFSGESSDTPRSFGDFAWPSGSMAVLPVGRKRVQVEAQEGINPWENAESKASAYRPVNGHQDPSKEPASASAAQLPMSAAAKEYLIKALDAMEKHSMRTRKIDWPSVKRTAFEMAVHAQSTADTYEAIRWAVKQLGDGHSFFSTPTRPVERKRGDGAPSVKASERPQAKDVTPDANVVDSSGARKKTRTVENSGWVIASTAEDMRGEVISTNTIQGHDLRIGYILVPSFGGQQSFDPDEAGLFANTLHEHVRRLSLSGATAWIVDLRYNSGGNMWPMLAGISPLLGAVHVGSFVAEGQGPVAWECNNGRVGTPGSVSVAVENPLTLQNANARVAVLIGRYCTSSGEAIAVALRGRDNSRFFGKPTGGATTSTQSVWMGDGAMLFVTNAIFADRTGRVYGGKLEPDEVIADSPDELADPAPTWSDDSAILAAVSWLRRDP